MKVNFRSLQRLILLLPDGYLVRSLESFLLPLQSADSQNEGQAFLLTLEHCLSLSDVVCQTHGYQKCSGPGAD